MINGITGWRTNDTTESFVVTTGAGETAQNITLSYDLYQAAIAEVESISSNETESPAATNYYESAKHLTVGGILASKTRTLQVKYLAETQDATMRIIGPFLAILIFGGCIYFIYKIATK